MEEGGYGHRILKKLDGLNWKLIASIEPETEVSKASRKFDIKSEIGFHLKFFLWWISFYTYEF